MPSLSDRLDDIAKKYWETWRTWRHGQGWRLGPDDKKALLSPFMVDNYDQLSAEGHTWFKQHTALVLWSISEVQRGASAPLSGADISSILDEVKEHFTKYRYHDASMRMEFLRDALASDSPGLPPLDEAIAIARHGPWNPDVACASLDLVKRELRIVV